jgi:two-component system phosphate regulon sensor histidine kinase PhoR
MTRTLFSRLFMQSVIVMLALAVLGGFALERFLSQREVARLEQHLKEQATLLFAELPATGEALQERIERRERLTGIRFTVITRDGTVTADSLSPASAMDNHATRPEVAAAISGEYGHAQRKSDTLDIEMIYVAIATSPIIRASMPLSNVEQLLGQIRLRLLWALLPAALLALTLAYTLSKALTIRLTLMKDFAGSLAAGDFTARLHPGGSDELSELERSLTKMKRDLEERKESLEAEKERLRTLVDGLRDGVAVFDGEGTLNAANRMAMEYLNLKDGNIKGMLIREAVRSPEILAALQEDKFTPPGQPGERISWRSPRRELEYLIHRVPDVRGKPGKMLVMRDVTHRVHLERVRSDFISNMAHELRTPLTAIRGGAETLKDSAIEDPEAAPRFLSTIIRHTVRLENILSDVADLSRIEGGGVPVKKIPFDAREPVTETVELFLGEAAQRRISLKARVPDELTTLFSDKEKIESILVNLVQNALRYSAEGTGEVTVAVKPLPDDTLAYVVTDNGIGIAKEAIKRVTERFYRVDPGRSRAQGGTGLGLAIVNHLVASLGGELLIESVPNEGTTVTVTLPAEASQPLAQGTA